VNRSTPEDPSLEDLVRVTPTSRNADDGAADGDDAQGQKPEGGDKKYAGKYESPEQLEEGYRQSSAEAHRLAEENKALKEQVDAASKKTEPKVDKDSGEVTLEQLRTAWDKDPVSTTLWMLKNVGREQAAEVTQELLKTRDSEASEAQTRQGLVQDYPDLANKDSKLHLESARLYALVPDEVRKANNAFALKTSVEQAAANLGITVHQKDERQRQFDVETHQVETSQGKGEQKETTLTADEKSIASKLGLSEEDYKKGLDDQGGRRVRVRGGGR
jgi:hypothetical protein